MHNYIIGGLRGCFWALLGTLGACAHGGGPWATHAREAGPQVVRGIDDLVRAQDPCLHVGVHVRRLDTGEALLDRRGQERFVRAFSVNLLTAAAALQGLGPNYRFSTQLFVDGFEPQTGTARMVYLKGSGDPLFNLGDLGGLLSALRQSGVRRITGELLLDDTDFDPSPWARGWMWDDLNAAYSAPVSALNLERNTLAVWAMPGAQKNAAVRVVTVPDMTGYSYLSNGGVTSAPRGPLTLRIAPKEPGVPSAGPPVPDALAGSSPKTFALAPGQEITVSGSLPLDAPARVRRLSVSDPLGWAAILVRRELVRYGVEPPVSIRRGSVSPTANLWAAHDSLPLNVLLAQWVKASDNHGMECLLKRLGAAMTLAPGTFESGAAQVRQYLRDTVGVDVSTLSLVDGSGASRYNLVAPAQLTATLQHAAQDFGTGAEMVASLAVGGVDGTVSRRFVGLPQGYRVRAKTGTMTGVSALLGLLEGPGHTPLVFAIMMDGALLPAEGLRKLQDDIVRRIAVGLLP